VLVQKFPGLSSFTAYFWYISDISGHVWFFEKSPKVFHKQFLQPTGVTPLQAEGITWDVEDFPDNTTILEKNKGDGMEKLKGKQCRDLYRNKISKNKRGK